MEKLKIAVAGLGYVGLSMAVLLSQRNSVTAVDVLEDRVDMVNRRISPLQDPEIEATDLAMACLEVPLSPPLSPPTRAALELMVEGTEEAQ